MYIEYTFQSPLGKKVSSTEADEINVFRAGQFQSPLGKKVSSTDEWLEELLEDGFQSPLGKKVSSTIARNTGEWNVKKIGFQSPLGKKVSSTLKKTLKF